MTGTETREMSDHGPIVRHLRLLHYIIMILCLAVFIFSVFNDKEIIEQAFAEEQELSKIVSRWHSRNFYNFCSDYALDTPKVKNTPTIKRYFDGRVAVFSATIDGKPHYYRMYNNGRIDYFCNIKSVYDKEIAYHSKSRKNVLDKINSRMSFRHHSSGIRPRWVPEKLSDLVKLWDTMNGGMRLYTMNDFDLKNAIIVAKEDIEKPLDQVKVLAKGMAHVKTNKVPEGTPKEQNFSASFMYHPVVKPKINSLFGYKTSSGNRLYLVSRASLGRDKKEYVAVIPIKTSVYQISILPGLFKKFGVNKNIVRLGTFEQSFPAMYSLVKDEIKKRQTKILRDYLVKVKDTKSQKFELGGLPIEINSIQKFGAMAIVALLLYYLLNLRALVYKLRGDNRGFATAWVGIYPDRTSFLFTLVTVLLIPIAVSLVQLWLTFDFKTLEGQVITGTVLFTLAIVSIFILTNSFKLFKKVRQYATRVK